MAGKGTEEVLRAQNADWQKDLARRQYQELRNELERVKQSMAGVGASDRAKVGRIDQLIRESDAFFEVSPRSGAASTRQRDL